MDYEEIPRPCPIIPAYGSYPGSPPKTPPLDPHGCHFYLPMDLLNEGPLIGAYNDILMPETLGFASTTSDPAQPLASPIDLNMAGSRATLQANELLDDSCNLQEVVEKEHAHPPGHTENVEHLISPVSSRRNSVETNYTTSQTAITPDYRWQAKPDLSPVTIAKGLSSTDSKIKQRRQRKRQARLPSTCASNPKAENGRSQRAATQQDGALRMRHNKVEKKYRNRLNDLFDQLASILLEIAGKNISAEGESPSKCHTLSKGSILQMACRNLEDLVKAKQSLQEEINWLRSNLVIRGAATAPNGLSMFE
ncbi:hypothetical protein B0I35DRAFT_413879 [Stachybotrys elegans]|uniref:BHLH domain-containing protein n=1 Tax=Stachybotrys elegans TaxID=80388 RepID=A0A8K0SDY4_9HYPO|nr:hypothetical protein B0I35DRAFT_413879 [Stachybotrys elegans]